MLGLAERLFLGDEPPQRSVIGEWLNWIDSAGLPHSVFGGTGAGTDIRKRCVTGARTVLPRRWLLLSLLLNAAVRGHPQTASPREHLREVHQAMPH